MKKVIQSLFICTVIVSLVSCQSEDARVSYLKDTDWDATHFNILMPTHNNSDSTYSVKADPTNWAKILNGQPSQFHFKGDGSYSEEYFGLDGTRVIHYQGTWAVSNDSLILNMEKPTKMKQFYVFNLDTQKGILFLSRKDDLDNDKSNDDQQVVQYKKQAKN